MNCPGVNICLVLLASFFGCSSEHQDLNDRLLAAIREKDSGKVTDILKTERVDLEPASTIHQVNKPLAYAAAYGNLEIVKLIVEQGADLDGAVAYGDVPLIKADEHENQDIINYLIEKGADVNKPNLFGVSPFIGFCGQGQIELVRLSINHGADLNKRYRSAVGSGKGTFNLSPLEAAIKYKKIEAVRLLLSKGADPSIKDPKGNSLASVAENMNLDKIAQLLKKAEKSKRSDKTSDSGRSDQE